MDRRVLVTILLVLVAVALATAVGVNAYQAGLARGLAESGQSGQVAPRPDGLPPYASYGPSWHRPWGFGFGFFGFLFPLLFFFLIFALLRGPFWGRPWGWHGGWRSGPPEAFEEWHRKAHESMPDRPQKA